MEPIEKLPQVLASWFGIVLGLAGPGISWRVAHHVWRMPAVIGESILGLAAIVWATLPGIFAVKWIFFRRDAHAELQDAIQSTYISLIGIGTNLIAIGLYPYSQRGALVLFIQAALVSVTHGVFFTSFEWTAGGHSDEFSKGHPRPKSKQKRTQRNANRSTSNLAARGIALSGVSNLAFLNPRKFLGFERLSPLNRS